MIIASIRLCRWMVPGAAWLALWWTSGCAYTEGPGGPPGGWLPPGPPPTAPSWPPGHRPPESPRPPQGRVGYIGTERESWQAWHNVMPGPGPATLHIEGVVIVGASNYEAVLRRRPSSPHALQYDVHVTRTADFGAQVLTRRQVRLFVPYDGRHDQLTVHFPGGERIRLGITRAY